MFNELYSQTAKEYFDKGEAKFKQNDYKGAITDYTKVIELEPNNPVVYNKGVAKSILENYRGAIDDYTKAIEFNPKDENAYYSRRGIAKINLEDYRGAIDDYTKAIELTLKTKWPTITEELLKVI